MNKVTLKARATLLGKVFASKGVQLTRAEQLELAAQLEGAKGWHHIVSDSTPSAPPPTAWQDWVANWMGEYDVVLKEPAYRQLMGANGPGPNLSLAGWQMVANPKVFYEASWRPTDIANFRPLYSSMAAIVGTFDWDGALSDRTTEGTDWKWGVYGDGRRIAATKTPEDARMISDALNACAQLSAEHVPLEVKSSADLALIPKASAPAPKYDVLLPNGLKETQRIRYLTDSDGLVIEDLAKTAPDEAEWIESNEQALGELMLRCVDEIACLAVVDGQRGVLYEVEIETAESEGEAGGKAHCSVSEEVRIEQLKPKLQLLRERHPNLDWSLRFPNTDSNFCRLVVQGFSPEQKLLSRAQAWDVMTELYKLFY